ncbi:hypothetical protein KUTeg_019896 [Tegillarca granosa]|uniref:Transporter n=1 Tax=Tegillarca granosa TaxID=220873 RepID=A0ABQ9EEC4_TEGGR|nr:hypothetical protein KUTeg_019896 [Tegillarca granosa]
MGEEAVSFELSSKEKNGVIIENSADGVKRDTWSGKLDFMMSCISFAVGLGNIWRFPYLCYRNGGGIGVGAMVVLFFLNLYYILVLAWAVVYLVMSFTTTLPWSHCNNYWNTKRCYVSRDELTPCGLNSTYLYDNSSSVVLATNASPLPNETDMPQYTTLCNAANITLNETVDAAVEFWERRVLQITDGIDNSGGIVWELALSLLLVWVIVYFSVWRGVHWTGKVAYVTATFPYLVLTILLIRGVLLEGSLYGITYYLKPDFTRLADSQVWLDGGTQIFFSYAVVLGGMISLGSYNKYNNNFYKDCTIIALINSGTSLYGGFAVFSVLGFMATTQGIDISKVAESGPGLVFIAYPKAVTQMPLSPLWSILFFIMLMLLGLGSQLVQTEAFITTVSDFFPEQLYNKKGRMIFVAAYCSVSYLLGLPMVTRGGMYIFQLMDYYSASGMVLLFLCFFESISIGWVFGADRFYDALEMMLGFRINIWLKICWKFLTPFCTLGIFMFQVVKFKPLKYNLVYDYPTWAQAFGLLMAIVSMLCIPAFIVYKIIRLQGPILKRLKTLMIPILKSHQIPAKWKETRRYKWVLADSAELQIDD